MSLANESRGKITRARNILVRRRRQTDNADEQHQIDNAIIELNDSMGLLNHSALLDAVDAVVIATAALEPVVASARLEPSNTYLRELENTLHQFANLLRNGEIGEGLSRASEVATVTSEVSGSGATSVSGANPATLPPISASKNFDVLQSEYETWFQAVNVLPDHEAKVDWHVRQLRKYEGRYREVSPLVNDVPWAMIGVIHAMECGFNFTGHLHNGDPLTSQTTRVPAGYPQTGTPPFSWEESARDALNKEGIDRVTDWSLPRMLYLLEKYNGFGYRYRQQPTPYLWSFSNLYRKGKFVADHVYDPDTVSKQCGAAVMLKALLNQGIELF